MPTKTDRQDDARHGHATQEIPPGEHSATARCARSAAPGRFTARTCWVGGWISALLLISCLALFVDLPLARYLHAHVSPAVDHVFEWIGEIGDSDNYSWTVLLAYAAAMIGLQRGRDGAWLGGCERVARGCLLLLAAWMAGGIVTGLLKQIVARARPKLFFEQGFYGLGDAFHGKPFNSFPSSHALTAFVVASVIAVVAPRWRWAAYAAAVLAAVSRLVNLDHFASDVTASALIAITAVHVLKPWFLDPHYRWPRRMPWRWFARA
jgi:membrane-associated phospholipid phosphatase